VRIFFESVDESRDAVFDERHLEVDEQAAALVSEPEVAKPTAATCLRVASAAPAASF
jgi:hypothetical protein